MLLEKVSEKKYRNFLSEYVLLPLGMNLTYLGGSSTFLHSKRLFMERQFLG
ncbi:MAG: hypothetical protein AB1521_12880 [Bacteroidota bacterium]